MSKRKGEVTRSTNETSISAKVSLDGTGKYEVSTGIGFLDHMLEQLSRHSLIDLELKAKGDLHIDFHHTTEDCGYAVGGAIAEALGDRKGITRFADVHIPMDETLSRVAVDLSGRAYLVWQVNFTRDKLGEMDTELFKEFFQALSVSLGANIHVANLYGENNHHMIESCFKGLARCLRMAVAIDDKKPDAVASTKGALINDG